MSYTKNTVTLVGFLGAAPEIKPTQNGEMAILSIATQLPSYKAEDGSVKEGRTIWHRATTFAPRAVNFAKHLKKGEKVAVEGYSDNREYQKDGKTVYIHEVVFDQLDSLSVKPKAAE